MTEIGICVSLRDKNNIALNVVTEQSLPVVIGTIIISDHVS